MAAFRRCIVALAIMAVFAGLASAIPTTTPASCNVVIASAPNSVRNEGQTDLVGDLEVVCTGGSFIGFDALVPRVTFQVTLGAPVTSRILKNAGTVAAPVYVSEALLTIDEPGRAITGDVPNFESNQAATPCLTNENGCNTTSIYAEQASGGIPVIASTPGSPPVAGAATSPNVFQGIVSGNTLTFYGVPVLAPVSANTARVFRLTNVRVNSTALAAGTTIAATVAVSCYTASATNPNCTSISSVMTIGTATTTVGTVATGLNATSTTSTASSAPICNTATVASPAKVGTISFGEGFATAFKTRQYGSIGSTPVANSQIPGGNYSYEESGLILTNVETTSSTPAGLADFGTRLKASFSNIPSGVRLFVSTTNVDVHGNAVSTATFGTTNSFSLAQLVATNSSAQEFAADAASPSATTIGPQGTPLSDGSGNSVQEVALSSSGSGEAVWEMTSTQTTSETVTFNIYIVYTSNVPGVTGTAAIPTPTAVLSFAPAGTAPTSFGADPVAATPVPYFSALNSTANNVFNLTNCRTILLFPFVTSQSGFDTGIAISNTSSDPLGTTGQSGSCALSFYGTGAPTTAPAPVAIAAGTTGVVAASAVAPNFTGYMIAICSFQYAHGFGYLAEVNINYAGSMGYLALIIPDPGAGGTRGISTPIGVNESLKQ